MFSFVGAARRLFSQTPTKLAEFPQQQKTSVFKRPLPEHLIAFNSPTGRQLFQTAMAQGTIEPYFALCGNYTHQADVSGCGPATLTMVLNALERDPKRTWKGAWRFWADDMIAAGPEELASFQRDGVSFPQFARLAERHGLLAQAHHPTSLEHFVQMCERVGKCGQTHMVVSFSRPDLGQTGVGHFSPVGALARLDGSALILVMDVARFKYPAYWVRVQDMFEAMCPVDPTTSLPRGYLLLSPKSINKS